MSPLIGGEQSPGLSYSGSEVELMPARSDAE